MTGSVVFRNPGDAGAFDRDHLIAGDAAFAVDQRAGAEAEELLGGGRGGEGEERGDGEGGEDSAVHWGSPC